MLMYWIATVFQGHLNLQCHRNFKMAEQSIGREILGNIISISNALERITMPIDFKAIQKFTSDISQLSKNILDIA